MNKLSPLLRWPLIILAALIVLSTLKDLVIKTAIEISSSRVIGVQVKMGSFSLGLLTHKIHIKDLRLYNPPNFPNQIFLVMPEVTVDVDVKQLLKGQMHFPLVIFNMQEMTIFKNKDKKLNIDSIKIIEEQKAANKGKPMKLPIFKIDTLKLNLGKVIVEDHTHDPPTVEAYDVAIKDKSIRNIDGLPKLMVSVIIEAIKPTAIRSAGLLAAQTILGVGFLPAAAFSVIIAQDDEKSDFRYSSNRLYQESLKLLKEQGTVKKEDPKQGLILGKIYGTDITITIQDKGWNRSSIMIKARKYMLARLEVANGFLYQLKQRLK